MSGVRRKCLFPAVLLLTGIGAIDGEMSAGCECDLARTTIRSGAADRGGPTEGSDAPPRSGTATEEVATYRRAKGEEFVKETEIRLRRNSDGRVVSSVTTRGKLRLSLTARYDRKGRLIEARVTLAGGGKEQSATAREAPDDGKVTVVRPGKALRTFDCPPGVIVTSAPDWTDIFSVVRRYDSHGRKVQEFAGLWIHPRREPQRITFKVTRLGKDVVRQDGRPVELDRLLVQLRGGSRYLAWRGPSGALVQLVPERKGAPRIVLAGWEKASGGIDRLTD